MFLKRTFYCCSLLLFACLPGKADNGRELWLRRHAAKPVKILTASRLPLVAVAKQELEEGWTGSAGATLRLIIKKDALVKDDGFKLDSLAIQANTEAGILYGAFELLRRQQTGEPVNGLVSNPSYQRRILDHWDNLDGSIERGYAGLSIFWKKDNEQQAITEADRELWRAYARANAAIGINGAVLNNVNASPKILDAAILRKVQVIAGVLRSYGVKTYLSVNFSSPVSLGGLKTADPLAPEVVQWWKNKIKEIYTLVPDFGGFLVKANSEGQPGPQDFGRTHADGANMLAGLLKPFGGMVMWRAFVYNPNEKDRAKQAYTEFMPLDGRFDDNVIVQVKNGPIDFQPREPFNPLFGAMKKTPLMAELQITQEYLGQSYQLAFLATMWEEFFRSDTYQQGRGSTVARLTAGNIYPQKYTAIAGVANIGRDSNWCGHPFAQANWYAFGRLAWNNEMTSDRIAGEWLRLSFSPADALSATKPALPEWEEGFLKPVKDMMLQSREAVVDYMMPLGLHHLFAPHHHYGPGPWWAPAGMRTDWTPPYYHKADSTGIGFDRTATGTGAVTEYHPPLSDSFENAATCPDIYLLWFHHLPWNYTMKSGRSLWDELCFHYDRGLKQVRSFQAAWDRAEPFVDQERFALVQSKLRKQARDAQVWKDACLLYFQQFSRQPIPFDIERPVYDLNYLTGTDPLTGGPFPAQ